MSQALRSPGSALKPFIYGLAFEDGLVHPETLIEDRPTRYGNYAPENFDQTFQGTVTVRRALQMSLNVPAVALLDKVGASRLTTRLAQAGGPLALPKGEVPGLAMGLGGVGVKLTDLTMLYAGLARLGTTIPLVERADDLAVARPPQRLLDPVAAWYVGNVLIGTPPPENAAHHRIAFKTGTSYGYRDAWAVGFDGNRTIGVWVGRPDGAPVPGLIGRGAAAPILFDAFARTGQSPAPLAAAPKGAIMAATGKVAAPAAALPAGLARRRQSRRRRASCSRRNGSRIELGRGRRQARAGRAQDRRRGRAADRPGQWHAGGRAGRKARGFLRSGRSGLCPPDGDGRQWPHRQRGGARAISLAFPACHTFSLLSGALFHMT